MLLHAAQISLAYGLWLGLLAMLLGWLQVRGLLREVRVWHVWAVSLAGYLLGYFAAGFDDPLTVALHADVAEPRPLFHFLRLLPVWVVVTWLFTQFYVSRSQRDHIERLARLNAALAQPRAEPRPPPASEPRVVVTVGRTHLDAPARAR